MRYALLALAVLAATPSPARAQDRTKAAEYFALAQSAERRSDWATAIRNYELAYKESPHPNVLYNIGLNYERLGRLRTAADYLLRYVDAAPDAEDRAQVLLKVRKLRERPAEIRFHTKPPGAAVFLDGAEIGKAPFSREVSAGAHDVYAIIDGKRSRTRRIRVQFGERFHVELRIGAQPGRLLVSTPVKEARVTIDGIDVGMAPYDGELDAGKHTVVVSAAGYEPETREVVVPAQGSEQIVATLEPLPGTKPQEKLVGARFLLGGSSGGNIGTEDSARPRALFQIGYRTAGGRFDLMANFGLFGFGPAGVGSEARLYVGGKRVLRYYLRGGLAVATSDDEFGARPFAFEAGFGINLGAGNPKSGYEFFAEANVQIARGGSMADDMDSADPTPPLGPLAAVRLNIPLTFGLAYRFGG